MKITNAAKGIIGTIEGSEPENEANHFYVCKVCGQAVDMRDLGQVVHHEDTGHEPIDFVAPRAGAWIETMWLLCWFLISDAVLSSTGTPVA